MKAIKFLLIFILFITIGSCKKSNFTIERTYYLSFPPHSPGITEKEKLETYDYLKNNCDLITHHLDLGVPWQEAYDSIAFPIEVQNELNDRKNNTPFNFKTILAVTPLSSDARHFIAKDWPYKANISDWKNKSFADSSVIKAYINYCIRLIDHFNPYYINYAIECNSNNFNAITFSEFEILCSAVYNTLKQKYPGKIVFLSFMVNGQSLSLQYAKRLEQYSDLIAVSYYPYNLIGGLDLGSTNPDLIPENLLDEYRNLNTLKPFAIAETGYIAQDLDMSQLGYSKKGTAFWQNRYLELLFTQMDKYEAEFIVWFVWKDYDNLWSVLSSTGSFGQAYASWKDTGLIDEIGNKRLAERTWNKKLKCKKK